MDCLFDYAIFDPDIFHTCYEPIAPRTGSARRNRESEWWKEYQSQVEAEAERNEMKLSQILAEKLQQTILENQLMMAANNSLLKANNNLLGVVDEIQKKAVVVPTKPEIDPKKKEELLRRLDMARQAKEEKKRQEEEKKKQMLRNLAKARRVKARNKGN